jgi:hypothetical protein
VHVSVVCAALADPERLQLFGVIAQRPDGVSASDLDLNSPARRALEKLLRFGLVERSGDRYIVRAQTFRDAWQAERSSGAAVSASGRVAGLFSGAKLKSMPRAGELRTEMLRYLAERFELGRVYREPELRDILLPVYDDHVALRRYLVDEGLLGRDSLGSYWRIEESSVAAAG